LSIGSIEDRAREGIVAEADADSALLILENKQHVLVVDVRGLESFMA